MLSLDYEAKVKIESNVEKLEVFLNSGDFAIPVRQAGVNISNQEYGKNYVIPFHDFRIPPYKAIINPQTHKQGDQPPNAAGIHTFFELLEDVRKSGIVLKFQELQVFSISVIPIERQPQIDVIDTFADVYDEIAASSSAPVMEQTLAPPPTSADSNGTKIDKIESDCSCIELDFDIYQTNNTRIIDEQDYRTIIAHICNIMQNTLELADIPASTDQYQDDMSEFYACVLRKADVRPNTHPKYGNVFKESFHIRIFLRVPKYYKQYLIDKLIDDRIVLKLGKKIQICNPDSIIDKQSAVYPAMFLGSAKIKSNEAHELYLLYKVQMARMGHDYPIITVSHEFDPIEDPIPAPGRGKRPSAAALATIARAAKKYKYNLCYETSLNYEAPNGLIKKPLVNVKLELATKLKADAERRDGNHIRREELTIVRNQVADLTCSNFEADYIAQILDILDIKRAQDFESWKSVVCILARANPDYKPLAIHFSHRCPQSWAKNGMTVLNGLWDWALKSTDTDRQDRSINTIFYWAKEDNYEKFVKLQDKNAFHVLQEAAIKSEGILNETHMAKMLYIMFHNKFLCDEDPASNSKGLDRRWYEFVFPQDDPVNRMGTHYKWRYERYPDTLDRYIADKLPLFIGHIRTYISQRLKQSEEAADEKSIKYYKTINKNLMRTSAKCGEDTFIGKIIKRCAVHFRERGFMERLDRDGNVIGTANGVLRLFPKRELLETKHDILISRSCRVHYRDTGFHPNKLASMDPSNKVRELYTAIRRLFVDDEDAFEFIMCYLASSLDGRKKRPYFFLWLGEGANGKSFLLEMHIKTLRGVVENGYAAKMNSAYFTNNKKNATGPDSEKMMLKHARFAYCSETEAGAILLMNLIKEFTSETLSGNEKFMKQEMFEAFCTFVFCSNNDPRIQGRDHGTWRRLLAYIFRMSFVENPNPANPLEYKMDPKYIETTPQDPEYQRAYLEILVYFYDLFRDKYGADLNNIPKPSINKCTQTFRNKQDTIARFINERMIHVKDADEPAPVITLVVLAGKYVEWHKKNIDSHSMMPNKDIIEAFGQSSLRKYIKRMNNQDYVHYHRVLEANETNASTDDIEIFTGEDCGVSDESKKDNKLADKEKEVESEEAPADDDDYLTD